MENKRWCGINYIILVLAATLIFVVLYHNLIWGNSTNMFTDIGCDTLFMAYPNQYIRNEMTQGGYALNYGFGGYIPGKWYTMLQPFNWPQLFVSDLVIANIISLYLEHLVTAVFAYLFFKKVMKTESGAPLLCAIIWAYSGYAVLWSQHAWTINIAYFTAALYFIQCMLCREKKGYFVVIPFAILAFHSYYFFYMDGLFAAFYIIGYAAVNKFSIKKSLRNLVKLIGVGALSAGIGAVGLLPELHKYFISARTSVPEQKNSGIFQSAKYVFTTFGRLLSNDIFGRGNNFTGYYNYYEAAVLACTALLVPCIVILLRNKKYVKPIVTLMIISIVAVNLQISSFILNLDAKKPRWTYVLIFLMVLAVGYCVDGILQGNIRVKKSDFLLTGTVYAVIFAILLVGDRIGIADVKRMPCIVVVIFEGCYLCLLMCLSKNIHIKKVFAFLVIGVIAEMIVNNYGAVNKRDIVTKEAFENDLYNDGTQELLSNIQDVELYRVNKTFASAFYNDSMVQGYNGLGIYNSVNSKNLVHYYQSFGFGLLNGMTHYMYIGTDHTVLNTLLGVKYVVVKDGDAVPEGYSFVSSYGDKHLYLNENAVGFGYVYSNRMKKSQFDGLSMQDKENVLSGYYYMTQETDAEDIQDVAVAEMNVNDNLKQLSENTVYHSSLQKDTLELTVKKRSEDAIMLCIPLIYDTDWTVYVDSEKTSMHNINGGLIGVDLSSVSEGEHQIMLKYDAREYRSGGIISIIALIIYIGMGVLAIIVKKCKIT